MCLFFFFGVVVFGVICCCGFMWQWGDWWGWYVFDVVDFGGVVLECVYDCFVGCGFGFQVCFGDWYLEWEVQVFWKCGVQWVEQLFVGGGEIVVDYDYCWVYCYGEGCDVVCEFVDEVVEFVLCFWVFVVCFCEDFGGGWCCVLGDLFCFGVQFVECEVFDVFCGVVDVLVWMVVEDQVYCDVVVD